MSNGGFVSDVSYLPIAAGADPSLNLSSTFDISYTPLNISLLEFDENVFLDTSGILSKSAYDPSFSQYDAVVDLDVNLVHFRNMFGIESDSNFVDDDESNPALLDNVHFIVYQDQIASFIPQIGQNGIVTSGSEELKSSLGIAVSQYARQDFVRHLANVLFNTPYATELFINEKGLVDSASSAFNTAWGNCQADLAKVSNTGKNSTDHPYMTQADDGGDYYYLTDASSNAFYGTKNICGEIYKQLVSRDPERFRNTNTLSVAATAVNGKGLTQFYLPLIAGDKINIKITLNANSNQDTFGLTRDIRPSSFDPSGASILKLKPKSYLVRMTLVV